MKVRDKTKPKKSYKGRAVEAPYSICPCLSCFNVHDYGYRGSNGKWIENFHCATNYNQECPSPLPEPVHIIRPSKNIERRNMKKCLRCGEKASVMKSIYLGLP